MLDAPQSWGLASAVRDGTAQTIDWIEVKLGQLDLAVTVPRWPLRCPIAGRTLVASLDYAEQLEVCAALEAISVTHALYQALWRAAPVKLAPHPLVATAADAAQMGTLAYLQRANDAFDAEVARHADALAAPGPFARGFYKAWVIGPMMAELGADGAENEGFTFPDGHELQTEGGRHNSKHLDYSQWCWDIAKRWARRLSTGERVDLRELFCSQFPTLASRIRRKYPDALGAEESS